MLVRWGSATIAQGFLDEGHFYRCDACAAQDIAIGLQSTYQCFRVSILLCKTILGESFADIACGRFKMSYIQMILRCETFGVYALPILASRLVITLSKEYPSQGPP